MVSAKRLHTSRLQLVNSFKKVFSNVAHDGVLSSYVFTVIKILLHIFAAI